MKMLIVIISIMLGCGCLVMAEAAEYGVALGLAPVLNTPDFKAVFGGLSGKDLKTDQCGQVRELEYIALPGTVFTILEKQRSGADDIYQVETDGYTAPANVRLYVAGRFLKIWTAVPEQRRRSLPPQEVILTALKGAVGAPYVWGGNALDGVPELVKWFYKDAGRPDRGRLTLAGLDCSGLLYRATGGWTPRNTAQLTAFGRGVAIAGKRPAEIVKMLQPLDLIVWNGHVVIVLDRQTAIESRLVCGRPGNGGVVITQLSSRIAGVMRTRHPVDAWPEGKKQQDIFVVRRWYGSL